MASAQLPSDKLDDGAATAEPGYAECKAAKVMRGLEQARDRAALIPADRIWRDLGLER